MADEIPAGVPSPHERETHAGVHLPLPPSLPPPPQLFQVHSPLHLAALPTHHSCYLLLRLQSHPPLLYMLPCLSACMAVVCACVGDVFSLGGEAFFLYRL